MWPDCTVVGMNMPGIEFAVFVSLNIYIIYRYLYILSKTYRQERGLWAASGKI